MTSTTNPALRAPYTFIKALESDEKVTRVLARNEKSGEVVVVKGLPLANNPALEQEYRTAAEILERTYHPHLLRTYEHWTQDGTFYVAQAYCQGKDLEGYSVDVGKLRPVDQITRYVRLFKDVALGIEALHANGLVLGRLTPQELLIDSAGIPKLCCSVMSSDEKSIGRMKRRVAYMGTVASLAPEELKGAPSGIATDVYSLGAAMYSALAGVPLVSVTRFEDVAREVFGKAPEPPSKTNPEIPAELDAIVMGALERDPAKRTPSVREIARQLSRLLETRPKSASGLFRIFGR